MVERLRCGVVVQGLRAWQRLCIQYLQDSGVVSLEAIVDLGASARAVRLPGRSQTAVPMPYELTGRIAQSVRSLEDRVLDFILDLTNGDETANLIDKPLHGMWYFNHSDGLEFCSAEPYFWEIYHDRAVSGAMLLRRAQGDDCLGVLLKSGYFATVRTSHAENVDRCFLSSAVWPARVCNELIYGAASYFGGPVLRKPVESYGIPTPLERFRCGLRIAQNRAVGFSRRYKLPFWNIAVVRDGNLDGVVTGQVRDFSLLGVDVSSEFLADPSVFQKGGRTYVFCEQFRYANTHGRIAVLELGAGGGAVPTVAIDESFHMSYPQVFEFKDRVYCIPESSSANQVRLYEAADFPTEWKFRSVLLHDFPAVDPTILRYDSRWWLFCTRRGEGSCTDLYIWHADDLFGPWVAHARNPVKSDVRSARPAGSIIEHDGLLYRPAQDCSRTYGGRVVINKLLKLTGTEFEESVVGVLEAPARGRYRDGLHTISLSADRLVVDMKRYRFSWEALNSDVKANVRRALRRAGLSESQIERLKAYLKRASRVGR